ncbi:MAG: hypothetical protein HY874_03565 [Chloroflexi bacterium]|nr:hypothetical protein [Chloroflexota bacterium]
METDITYEPGAITERQTSIYRNGARYVAGQQEANMVPNPGCAGASKRILTIFANCPGERSKTETRVETRSLEGAGALAIVTTGSISGIDSVIEIHNALFVDPSTFLPLAFESKGTDRYVLGGHEQTFRTTMRYRIDFVRRESLPAGFFEAASIGVPDPERAIDAAHYAFPIFWPGREYAGDGAAPPLTLSDIPPVITTSPELGPLHLRYSRTGDVFARLLTITQTSAERARFDAATGAVPDWRRDPCASHEEMSVPGARAVLYRWHVRQVSACSSAPADGIVLEMDLGDTFVVLLPDISLMLANQPNPYASAGALANLARALTRR